jgi:hypothetical protein
MKSLTNEEKRVLTAIVNDERATEENLDLRTIFIIEKANNGFIVLVINGKKEKHIAKNHEDIIKIMEKYSA